ncbi:hypothetical protein PS865_03933 [Pseudomonas fluorescens]|uniref:AAA family ATPase n=1 Tax=Pseudomonas fluorescens TaxID=294 RepID=UPI001241A563|nr:hypothetical protein PS865_03933 [Pseudomonas fluorescens]
MIIESLTIEDLHKSINLTVNFNKDITLLVGINGCGKTSILNVIDWLLKPNLQLLAVTEYKKLELEFTFNKKKIHYILRQDRRGSSFFYSWSRHSS